MGKKGDKVQARIRSKNTDGSGSEGNRQRTLEGLNAEITKTIRPVPARPSVGTVDLDPKTETLKVPSMG